MSSRRGIDGGSKANSKENKVEAVAAFLKIRWLAAEVLRRVLILAIFCSKSVRLSDALEEGCEKKKKKESRMTWKFWSEEPEVQNCYLLQMRIAP